MSVILKLRESWKINSGTKINLLQQIEFILASLQVFWKWIYLQEEEGGSRPEAKIWFQAEDTLPNDRTASNQCKQKPTTGLKSKWNQVRMWIDIGAKLLH